MRKLIFTIILCLAVLPVALGASSAQQPDPLQPLGGVKADPVTYQVDLSAVVTPPYKCQVLKIWLPIPQSDSCQEVRASKLGSFPMQVEPKLGREETCGNQFAYFEFKEPQGAQMVRHQFTVKTWEMRWDVDWTRLQPVQAWPATFQPFLRNERLIPVDERFQKLTADIVQKKQGPPSDLTKVFDWVHENLSYTHKDASLQGSAVHAFEKKMGHCSDYHGLCSSLGRCLGVPTRIAYGINPYPKASPSHCKLEAFLAPHGWVAFDVSDTQNLLGKIKQDASLDEARKTKLSAAAKQRFLAGFRDNTWFKQTHGSDYELVPPAKNKVAVVRTIYAEADGVPLPEPDPSNPNQKTFSWMTLHHYTADRVVTNPLLDWRSLEK